MLHNNNDRIRIIAFVNGHARIHRAQAFITYVFISFVLYINAEFRFTYIYIV